MANHIYACNVITNVSHVVNDRDQLDDFLIVNVDHWEAAQFLGEVYVDAESMMRLIEWARNDDAPRFTLLISLDGKYGHVAFRNDIDKPPTGSEVYFIDDVWAPIKKVRAAVLNNLQRFPEVAQKLNIRAIPKAIPDRIKFVKDGPLRPGFISGEIGDAMRNIEGATDDALVWITMLGLIPHRGIDQKLLDAVKREVDLRIGKGSEFRATFFPLNQVPLKEIEARSRRAHRDLERFLAKFPPELEQNAQGPLSYELLRQVERYATRLSDDRLVELTVFLYNKAEWQGAIFKHFLLEFELRVSRAGE